MSIYGTKFSIVGAERNPVYLNCLEFSGFFVFSSAFSSEGTTLGSLPACLCLEKSRSRQVTGNQTFLIHKQRKDRMYILTVMIAYFFFREFFKFSYRFPSPCHIPTFLCFRDKNVLILGSSLFRKFRLQRFVKIVAVNYIQRE